MWRRSACAAAVLAVSVAPPASASPPVWRPLFASDFSDPTVPPECDSFDAPATVPGATYFRPDEVSVHDGMLHLSLHRRDYGQCQEDKRCGRWHGCGVSVRRRVAATRRGVVIMW